MKRTVTVFLYAMLPLAACGHRDTAVGDSGTQGDGGPGVGCVAAPTYSCTAGWQRVGGPLNVDLATGAYSPDVAAAHGDLVVAWSEFGPPYRIFVKRWDGTAWQQLGEALNVHAAPAPGQQGAQGAHVIFDGTGAPVVIWSEDSYHGYVKRWDGAAWSPVGDALRFNDAWETVLTAIAADRGGNLVAAWEEWDGDQRYDVFVARWDGRAWTVLGDGPVDVDPNRMATDPSVTIDCSGRPVVAWSESDADTGLTTWDVGYVKRWNGSSWELLGGSPLLPKGDPFSGGGPLAASLDGKVSVAFSDLHSVSASEWTDVIHVGSWDGAQWSELPVLGDMQAVGPSMVVDGAGAPVVAYRAGFGSGGTANSGVFVSAWNGSRWDPLGSNPLNIDMTQQDGDPHLALDPDGHPVVTFMEPDPTTGLERVVVEACR